MPAGGKVDFTLYLITDRHTAGGRPIISVVREALTGGIRAVQLREKDLSSRELFLLASEMRIITRDFGAILIINDRLDIAEAVDADGVHLGAGSLPVAEARRLLKTDMLIGYSAHGIEESLQAEAAGADFITFGPVYFTSSKASYGAPLGISKLTEAAAKLAIPVFALGGVNKSSIPEILAAGAKGISLISAVMSDNDPKAAAESLLKTLKTHATHS
jgi:thiamine-phosphate pyrophosphorylase